MIINSLLDSDIYKFSMGQVALHQFPWVNVRYEFKCRNKVEWNIGHLVRIKEEIENFTKLQLTKDELNYLCSIRFFKKSYIDFLKLYKPDSNHVSVRLENNELKISVEGPWFLTVYWEVPLLAIVSEVYFEHIPLSSFPKALDKLNKKKEVAISAGFNFVDFGTRRRFNNKWHDLIIENLVGLPNFKGTSNVMLAKKYGITPIGTQAHEFFMVHQALDVALVNFQKRALQSWCDEYRGDLGIALTDTIGIDSFLKDFDLYFAKLFSGLRQDSGDPIEWGEKVISHYQSLGIDSKNKQLVFSDGLNFPRAAEIYEKFKDRAQVSFGIGTNLTNDLGGIEPLQIVMKVVECNGKPVAKISDSGGKTMCEDDGFVNYLKQVFGIS